MKRTLSGFLEGYLRELSGMRTLSLRPLCSLAAGDAPRLAEPLMVYALSKGKADYLCKLSEGTWMQNDYRQVAQAAKGKDLADYLTSEASERYAKVYMAYKAQWDVLNADRRINALLRARTLDALEKTGMTRYALAKGLNLNLGNVYAYLAGDDAKVSADTARRLADYAASAC